MENVRALTLKVGLHDIKIRGNYTYLGIKQKDGPEIDLTDLFMVNNVLSFGLSILAVSVPIKIASCSLLHLWTNRLE